MLCRPNRCPASNCGRTGVCSLGLRPISKQAAPEVTGRFSAGLPITYLSGMHACVRACMRCVIAIRCMMIDDSVDDMRDYSSYRSIVDMMNINLFIIMNEERGTERTGKRANLST